MGFFRKLSIPFRTSIIVTLVMVVGFCASCWLIPTGYRGIPFGFLIAGGVNAALYALSGFFLIIDDKKHSSTFSIIAVIVRNVILVGTMIAMAFIDKIFGFQFYNLYVFVGVYTAGIIAYIIFNLVESKKEKDV